MMKKMGYVILAISIVVFSLSIISKSNTDRKYYFTTNGYFASKNDYANGSFVINDQGKVYIKLKTADISSKSKPKISLTSPKGEIIFIEGDNKSLYREIETPPGQWKIAIDGDRATTGKYLVEVWMKK